jgi:hypothetical protein
MSSSSAIGSSLVVSDPNKWYQSLVIVADFQCVNRDGGHILRAQRQWWPVMHSWVTATAFSIKAAQPISATMDGMAWQEWAARARGHHWMGHQKGGANQELPDLHKDKLLRVGRSHAGDATGERSADRFDRRRCWVDRGLHGGWGHRQCGSTRDAGIYHEEVFDEGCVGFHSWVTPEPRLLLQLGS